MRDPDLFLQDILDSCNRIERFIGSMSLDDFSGDEKTISAVRDQIMIIGEAVKQVPKDIKEKHPEVPWDEVAGMRDVLIHAYFRTDERLMYQTATRDIAHLIPYIKSMLDK